MPARSRLKLSISAGSWPKLALTLRKQIRRAHSLLESPLVEFSIALVGDSRMSALHERFMGIAGPTDVLTFPLDENAAGEVISGEVVVCVPEARRRCTHEGTQLANEVLLYSLHGLLHLCGYDDQTSRGFNSMHAKEDEILIQIGVGSVFKRTAAHE